MHLFLDKNKIILWRASAFFKAFITILTALFFNMPVIKSTTYKGRVRLLIKQELLEKIK